MEMVKFSPVIEVLVWCVEEARVVGGPVPGQLLLDGQLGQLAVVRCAVRVGYEALLPAVQTNHVHPVVLTVQYVHYLHNTRTLTYILEGREHVENNRR